jgi:ribonuclease T1
MTPRRMRIAPIVAALIAIFVALWHQRSSATKPAPAPDETPVASRSVETGSASRSVETRSASRLDALDASERAEVEKTLALIEKGGPFPYRKDGSVFSNRERRLPSKPRGYYREYTVETPGAPDRGARRVVRGSNGETYYTRDHYQSFIRVDT